MNDTPNPYDLAGMRKFVAKKKNTTAPCQHLRVDVGGVCQDCRYVLVAWGFSEHLEVLPERAEVASSPSPTPCDCEFKNGFHVCAATLNDATAKGDWVKVTPETNPTREGRYLVVYSQGRIRRAFIGDYDPGLGWANTLEDVVIEYWKEIGELPAPPEENRDE